MISKMEKSFSVPLSLCDNEAKLSIPSMFTLFMDIATQHANELKLSSKDIGENMFWLAVKTKLRIFARPEMSSMVTLSTWPEKPARIRANRNYTISDESGLLVCGKTEWAVIDTSCGKLQRRSDIYGEDFEYCEEQSVEEPYARVSDNFDDAEILGEYTVKSTDIDLGQHMNNSAYIRAFVSMFSCDELKAMDIKEIDIAYKAQSFEGETLTLKKREDDGFIDYAMLKSDNTVCATLRVVCGC